MDFEVTETSFDALAEYASIFVIASVGITLFWGGWLRPFQSVAWLDIPLDYVFPVVLFVGSGLLSLRLTKRLMPLSGWRGIVMAVAALTLIGIGLLFIIPAVNAAIISFFWFFLKVSLVVYLMIWIRGTFPRFRYDQLMNIGWKWLIPLGMVFILLNAVVGIARAS